MMLPRSSIQAATQSRRGFTYIELMVTLTIIAVLTMVVLPSFRDNDRMRLMAGSQLLIADIETAQVMTIAVPDDPVVVRLDPDNNRYWLAYADDPETPITHASSGDPYLVTFGEGRASTASGVVLAVKDCPQNTIIFDSNGGLVDFTIAPTLTVSLGDDSIEIMVAPTTGTIFEREFGDDEPEEEGGELPLEEPLVDGGGGAEEEEEEGGGGLLGGLLGGLGL